MDKERQSEALFINLIMMFHSLAWQQLGKVKDPSTGKVSRNLEAAKALIDTIEMLEKKTEGKRTAVEEKVMSDVLKELRLNYVDEINRKPEEKKPADDEGNGSSDSATGGSAE
ncbi:MAG: DUF1844 domain-containing protein [Ignavibacteria bacterium]|nr:DUF1844 domain-containing protein [Ignavibacteria bacterium]